MRHLPECYPQGMRLKHHLIKPMQTRKAIRHPDGRHLLGGETGEHLGAA